MAWALIGTPAPALASDRTYAFNVSSQDTRSAVVSVATTAQISVGGLDPRLCAVRSSPVRGQLSALIALNTLLSHSACVAQAVDQSTYVLLRRPVRRTIAKAELSPSPATPEVIVTANRRSQLAGDAASAISVISGSTLGRSDEGLGAIANRVPGMTMTNLGSGRDKILLRGISDGVFTGRTQSTVGLYLDDTPITFNAPDPDLLLTDIDHIEVLRGPQGALYGEGSISGVVSLISHKPDLGLFADRFEAGYGLTRGGAPSSRLEAMVNLPLVLDRLGVRLVAYDDQSGGYIDDMALGKTDANSVRRYGGRLSGLWQITDNWSATLRYASQEINAKNSHYVSGNMGAYARTVALAEPHDNDFSNLSLSLDGQTKVGRLHVSVNHLHHHIQSRYDASAQAAGLATDLGTLNSGKLAYDESQRVELETADITLTSRPDTRLRWLIGAFLSNSSEDFLPHLADALTSTPLYMETRRDRINSLAVYGEGSFDITPRLTVTAGLRGTSASHDVNSMSKTYAAFEINDGQQARIRNQHLSHQLVLRYRASTTVMVYAQSAEGYRDAGFNTTRLATSPAVPQIYAGDELNSYEAGLKLNLPVQRLRVNAALFRVLWRDIQSDQLQTSGLPLSVNIGNGENTGLELEGDWTPFEALTLHGAALVNEPRLTRPNSLYATSEDAGLPFIARQSYSVSADWQKRFQEAWLDASATLAYRGVSHLNFGALQTVEMGGYSQLDLAMRLNVRRLHYSLRVDNATGTTGNSFAYGNPFSLGLQAQSTPLRPRTVWLSLGFDY